MFDKIHFNNVEINTPLTQVTKNDLIYFTKTKNISDSLLSPFKGLFSFPGSIKALVLHPVPQDFNMIYLQSFSLMHMTSSYYTTRKDYNSYLMLYTYDGEGQLTYEGKVYSLKKNDIFIIDCRTPHTYCTIGEYWLHSVLHFNGNGAEYIYNEFYRNGHTMFHCNASESYQTMVETMLYEYETAYPHRDFFFSARLMELFRFLLSSTTIHSTSTMPEYIQLLLHYMESNYNKQLSLDTLSVFANVSKYHLSREFKKHVGFSPNDYLIHIRLMHAKQLLIGTTFPVCQIGFMVGIPNQVNFQRLFKKDTGITPGAFREQY